MFWRRPTIVAHFKKGNRNRVHVQYRDRTGKMLAESRPSGYATRAEAEEAALFVGRAKVVFK